jgi:hypothetical protein
MIAQEDLISVKSRSRDISGGIVMGYGRGGLGFESR